MAAVAMMMYFFMVLFFAFVVSFSFLGENYEDLRCLR